MTPTRSLTAASLFVAACTLAAVGSADPPKPAPLPPPAAAPVDFDKDVKPILAAHCLSCHGAAKQKGGLRLDNRKAALEGGNGGAVIAVGKSAESRLVHAVAGTDPDAKMPPDGKPGLTAAQVGVLRKWIDSGAVWGMADVQAAGPAKSIHWAFQPVKRPPVPTNPGRQPGGGPVHPIDAFVLAKLGGSGLAMNPPADRATLLRRVTLDLTGLPPTPAEVEAFLKDDAADAYEKVVDRLLTSPHYGERWGRHWLDAARYADSDGYEKDTGRPFAWRFRDWVIAALNRDLAYDQFTIEQLAGDLIPNATTDQKVATGFHRNTLTNKEGGVDQEEFRVAAVVDRVSTTGKVWLGLTVGCCQCHDHKYDPLSHREFYQFFAFFNSDREADIPAPLPGEAEKLKKAGAAAEAQRAKLSAAVAEAKEKSLSSAEIIKREKALTAFEKTVPTATKAQTLTLGPARPTHVMIRGDFLRKGVKVEPGTPAVLPPMGKTAAGATRLDLAKWVVSGENPLTARVAVNWVWGKYFGRGLVGTPDDFGTQGEKPSHPELLDWLASEFVKPASRPGHGAGVTSNPTVDTVDSPQPWSLKRLHKLIVTSAAYRQSSGVTPDHLRKDPLNVLLARQPRLRLEAELVRDGALAASGLLARTVGGPSVRPPQPAGISELTYAGSAKWVESTGGDRYRRGMYTWFQRTSPYPMLMAFDAPESTVCAVRRERSNTPLQALTLLNDATFVEAAQALAKRVQAEAPTASDAGRVEYAVRLTVGRDPKDGESARLLALKGEIQALAKSAPADAAKLVGGHKPAGVPADEAAAWVAVCRTLLNLDEFVTRE